MPPRLPAQPRPPFSLMVLSHHSPQPPAFSAPPIYPWPLVPEGHITPLHPGCFNSLFWWFIFDTPHPKSPTGPSYRAEPDSPPYVPEACLFSHLCSCYLKCSPLVHSQNFPDCPTPMASFSFPSLSARKKKAFSFLFLVYTKAKA